MDLGNLDLELFITVRQIFRSGAPKLPNPAWALPASSNQETLWAADSIGMMEKAPSSYVSILTINIFKWEREGIL